MLSIEVQHFAESLPFKEEIHSKHVLVTGATGLIGSTIIRCLLAADDTIQITAPVRNVAKMESLFGPLCKRIQIVECDLESYDYNLIKGVDYIFHCASPTASRFFITKPVETAHAIYRITDRLLEYAKTHTISGMIYLSSLEVYGSGVDNQVITEDIQGYWDTQDVRSSYPMAKRAAENLCHLYAKEYNVPVKIARLTQTTGIGVDKDDNHVINQFARLASLKQDIVLHSTGDSARPYCYTLDCITALLYILLKGTNGEAYNVANSETFISARGLAEYIRDNFAPSIRVVIDINENMGYAPPSKLNLSTAKLEALGWKPQFNLHDIIQRMIDYYEEKLK